jgi:hypothetical protein
MFKFSGNCRSRRDDVSNRIVVYTPFPVRHAMRTSTSITLFLRKSKSGCEPNRGVSMLRRRCLLVRVLPAGTARRSKPASFGLAFGLAHQPMLWHAEIRHCQVEANLYDFQARSTNGKTGNQQVSSCPGW